MQYLLNENIKELRIQNGMSQVEFAHKLSVSKQCVSNWENDNVMPSIEMLVKIADLFNVTTDYLLGRNANNLFSGDGLTLEQSTHIKMLIADLQKANR